MSNTTERILRYYAPQPGKEWKRLAGPDTGPIEFELTTRQLSAYLKPGSRVLDIGGGPGRYTLWLAAAGHRPILADLVPQLLVEARNHLAEMGLLESVEEVIEADVCNLRRWDAASFDAALCLGPFYHLPEPERRDRAAAELARIIRPEGLLFAAFMPRLGFLKRTIAVREEWGHWEDRDFLNNILEHGAFYNDNPGRFDAGYGARPEEIGPFFESHGFATEALLAAEGFAPPVSAELEAMRDANPAAFAAALDTLEATAAEPSILGAANHLLYIGRRV
ncbi:MAG: class I SAM-dependent methyltransferase [Dehalococcoidia bacterium]